VEDGWEGLASATVTDMREVITAREDTDRLCLRVFGSEDGVKLLAWLRQTIIEHPVCVPGSDPSFGYYREGQCSVVRDLEARIKRSKKL